MRDIALTDMERLGAFDEADRTFQMTEDAFRSFYELTARPVRVYLARMTGDDRLAEDLLQETYYRFLRSTTVFESDDHRRHYLFRIATNLIHDHRRRPAVELPALNDSEARASQVDSHLADRIGQPHRRVPGDGPAQAARAQPAVARVRARLVARGNRRRRLVSRLAASRPCCPARAIGSPCR